MNPRNLLTELKRRKVYGTAVAYVVVAWLIIQVATQTFPFFNVPNWAIRLVILLLIVGFPLALVLSWAFELTPEGVKRVQAAGDEPVNRGVSRKLIALTAVIGSVALGMFLFRISRPESDSQDAKGGEAPTGISPKSIAVLPFENLSANPENAFFAEGVQDEILSDLARIADLKVISRTSVMNYKSSAARNLRELGRELGVARVLEGSVQRASGKVRVNVQLIDARSDAHLWAQTYDRDLADVFAIQSEIAKAIAEQLRAKLLPSEKAEIERSPTADIPAFDLYARAKTLLAAASLGEGKDNYLQAVDLLNRATERDPAFFAAYCQLVHAHAELYFYNFDHTPTRLSLADAALQNAIRLQPDAGETHLARAEYLYRCYLDYDHARTELDVAARTLPNNSRVFALTGFIDRRQGRWEEAIRNFEKALEFDPRNRVVLQQIGASYPYLRRFRDEAVVLDRILALTPHDVGVRISRAFVDLEMRANVQPYRNAVQAVLLENPDSAEEIASEWFAVAWYERNAVEATRAATAIPAEGAGSNAVRFPHAWYEGLAARLGGNIAVAHEALLRARAVAEHEVQERPDYGPPLCVLGMIDAMLDRKDDAVKEGRHAVELLSVEKDSINGSHLLMHLAMIYAAANEKESAVECLHVLLSKPGDGSYGDFCLNPFWDPLRGDPRFEKLLASLASKDE
jgi:TolB-like protein